MKTVGIVASLGAIVLLSGCATYAEKGATKSAADQCAAMGMQFVKTQSKKSEGIIMSTATVTGECIGPDDPRWVAPEAG